MYWRWYIPNSWVLWNITVGNLPSPKHRRTIFSHPEWIQWLHETHLPRDKSRSHCHSSCSTPVWHAMPHDNAMFLGIVPFGYWCDYDLSFSLAAPPNFLFVYIAYVVLFRSLFHQQNYMLANVSHIYQYLSQARFMSKLFPELPFRSGCRLSKRSCEVRQRTRRASRVALWLWTTWNLAPEAADVETHNFDAYVCFAADFLWLNNWVFLQP